MTSTSPDVLIVGAGPVGLVSALALAQSGVHIRIVDKMDSFAVGQRGAGTAPRTLEAYKILGVLDDIHAAGAKMANLMREYDQDGKLTQEMVMMETQPETAEIPYPNFLHLGQDSTTAVLRKHLAKYNVSVELETELVSLEQDNDGVSVTLRSPAGEEQLRVKYVVGADGGQGVIRKLVGIKFLGESHRNIRVAIGEVDLQGLDYDHWHRFAGSAAGNGLVLRPLPERHGAFWTGIMGADFDIERGRTDLEYITSYVREVTKHDDINITKVDQIRLWSLNIRLADTFHVGRVFIAGDAAHVHSPTGGQGMNSGVMDAMNLSWKLALACKSLTRNPKALLDSYTNERLPVIQEMLEYTSKYAAATFKQPRIAKPPSESPFRRALAGRQLGVHCRWSSIVRDELDAADTSGDPAEFPSAYSERHGTDRVHAGDRAPNARGTVSGAQTTLFDLFTTRKHTVLVLKPSALSDVRRILDKLPSGIAHLVVVSPANADVDATAGGAQAGGEADIFIDTEGSIARAYGGEKAAEITVVRPDGVVGALLVRADGLETYFSAILGQNE